MNITFFHNSPADDSLFDLEPALKDRLNLDCSGLGVPVRCGHLFAESELEDNCFFFDPIYFSTLSEFTTPIGAAATAIVNSQKWINIVINLISSIHVSGLASNINYEECTNRIRSLLSRGFFVTSNTFDTDRYGHVMRRKPKRVIFLDDAVIHRLKTYTMMGKLFYPIALFRKISP